MSSKQIAKYINQAENIVIIQADNPDGDSLSSALALEQILGDTGKKPVLYCGVDIPSYLRYMDGWDRVSNELPKQFDLSIIVDNSSLVLLETLLKTGQLGWLKTKLCVVIDHHATGSKIDFAKQTFIKPAVSTTELIYLLARENKWPVSKKTAEFICIGILSDSMGLTTEQVNSDNVRIIAEMLEKGVSLSELDAKRRALSKKTPQLIKYKGKLLDRISYAVDNKVAFVDIPWEEIEKYSPHYNPPMLVIDEMRQISGVVLAIAFKSYPGGRITAKLRSEASFPYCGKLAEHFGGGGHAYASGFRKDGGTPLDKIKAELFKQAEKLLNEAL